METATASFSKKTIDDVKFSGRRALVRVDFNVPMTPEGKIADDTRLRESLPTLRKILADGGSAVLMSHMGRPKGKVVESMRLAPIAAGLSERLGRPVRALKDCVGPEVEREVASLKPGDVALLENLRFHPEEEKNDPGFSKSLARLGSVYVNDAFGTAHRAHASTVGVTEHLKPRVAGYLMKKEIEYLGRILSNPARPFVAVFGGAKVSSKLSVLKNLLTKVDRLLIGGAMTYTFVVSQGGRVGKSLCERELADEARNILEEANRRGVEVLLPTDSRAVQDVDKPSTIQVVPSDQIPDDREGVDIGPDTVKRFSAALRDAKTVFWNGPLGKFERPEYADGTFSFARALASSGATKVVGGGDCVSAVHGAGVADKIDHISTGGGASMEFLEGQILPGVAALDDR
ncbi:MAG: phosphoglycerate kinase [Candidatus Lindowbacteria bacterium RIFCSPLOWO2_12_FULL_62_27]|nr:MAG: phosphoglycerate kinase [Candidatus Lindowbacteria bacterium RIFCSPLOWO2_12_FULL_62_27]OGH58160.1 MAG: phosphoglycerate kinase [Candidatus Lindowbacteria bacterium RIFCSPLOWO2_02_FULL_62_12]